MTCRDFGFILGASRIRHQDPGEKAIVTIQPLAGLPIDPLLASLPKADLHLHQEELPRLDRIVARWQGRQPFDWRKWAQHLLTETPGPGRLNDMFLPDASLALVDVPGDDPEFIIAKPTIRCASAPRLAASTRWPTSWGLRQQLCWRSRATPSGRHSRRSSAAVCC